MNTEKDNAGVIAPPPLIFLSGLIVGGVISWFYHIPILPRIYGYILGTILAVSGLCVVVTARRRMAKVGTDIKPWKPTTTILKDGIYRVSRNPIYVAMVALYIGISFLVNSLWMLLPLFLVIITIHFGVILREEKYLEQKFGEEYSEYKNLVRRWL